jgi:hypothetical protein
MDKLTVTEEDIQIAAIGLCDYLRDLLLISGHNIEFKESYQILRIAFGNKVVDLVRAIKEDISNDQPPS